MTLDKCKCGKDILAGDKHFMVWVDNSACEEMVDVHALNSSLAARVAVETYKPQLHVTKVEEGYR